MCSKTIKEIGEKLTLIGNKLAQNGFIKLGKSTIKPNDPSLFVIRYERMPHGELCLKLEVRWDEEDEDEKDSGNRKKADLVIE